MYRGDGHKSVRSYCHESLPQFKRRTLQTAQLNPMSRNPGQGILFVSYASVQVKDKVQVLKHNVAIKRRTIPTPANPQTDY